MKNILKIIFTCIVFIFIGYVIYRNVELRHVPTSDLIRNEDTSKLYRSIMPNTDNPKWITYYYNNDTSINTIPLDMKYNIAFKATGTGLSTIDEKTFKEAYESIFGKNSYIPVNSFIGGCSVYYYDSINELYKYKEKGLCKDVNISILSRIIDANEKDDAFDLTVEIAYLDNKNKKVYRNCDTNLSNCSGVIKENFSDFDESNLAEKDYNLHKFKFYYTSKNGKYYFDHNEKIK